MNEIRDEKLARATFDTLCGVLDKNEWHYQKDEEKMYITCGVQGEDLPIELSVDIDADRMVAILVSPLPFTINEDKRLDMAIVFAAINNSLIAGSFDYDITTGRALFRMSNSFLESVLGDTVFEYMMVCACKTVDDYNDKLLMLVKDLVTVEQFITSLQ